MSSYEDWQSNHSQNPSHPFDISLEAPTPTVASQEATTPSTASAPFNPTNFGPGHTQYSTATQSEVHPPLITRGRSGIQERAGDVPPFSSPLDLSDPSTTATSPAGLWYSQDDYQRTVAHLHARRSRSQPPRPGETFTSLNQPPPDLPANMSAYTQILPSPSSHFGHGQDFLSSSMYSANIGYDSMATLPNQSVMSTLPEGRPSTISPRLLPSSPPYANLSRVSKPASRSPPVRERAPLRHCRSSVFRARSGSRPEALLAYAQDQQQQQQQVDPLMPSQSTPNTPPIFATMNYSAPVSSGAPLSQSSYYIAPPMPQNPTQFLTPHSYNPDQRQSTYFNLTRSASQPTLDLTTLNPQDAVYLPNPNPIPSNSPSLPSLGSSNIPATFPPPMAALESSPDGFRILASRPKPQCFDHGCNGRQFSTFSNLLRHQREKSGSAMKAVCPHCGTEFTRTTARNGHLWGGKCKGRGGPDGPVASSDGGAPSTTGSE